MSPPREELRAEVFEQVFDINLIGLRRACETTAPLLKKPGGSIINIALMLSFFGGGLVPGSCAPKSVIAQLTRSLAIAYADRGIRVNAIAPGWIANQWPSRFRTTLTPGPILSRTSMAHRGRPEDLRGVALFLARPHAGFITGSVIPVDGGY